MYQVNNTADIAEVFKKHLAAENFVTDKTGQKTIEIIGASFIADQPAIFGEPNEKYIEHIETNILDTGMPTGPVNL